MKTCTHRKLRIWRYWSYPFRYISFTTISWDAESDSVWVRVSGWGMVCVCVRERERERELDRERERERERERRLAGIGKTGDVRDIWRWVCWRHSTVRCIQTWSRWNDILDGRELHHYKHTITTYGDYYSFYSDWPTKHSSKTNVGSIWATFDSSMKKVVQVNKTTQTSWYHLYNISIVKVGTKPI